MSDLNSLLLVYKAQSGDCQAFTALIEPHLRRIYATAMEITKNPFSAGLETAPCKTF
jgi:hypothetical protein